MQLSKRIYEDYLKKSRLSYYEHLLYYAKERGYMMTGVLGFYRMLQDHDFDFTKGKKVKVLINRHDIDTSPKVAYQMFQIEQMVYGKQGSTTYYFRNSTVDKKIIKEIEQYGYETGYHYEEIADYEKEHRIKNKELLFEHLPQIREKFLNDLESYRSLTETQSLSIASHGDFINTKYQMQNTLILEDESTRQKSGIEVEAYDESMTKYIEARFADQMLLEKFYGEVIRAMRQEISVIMILTHPRNWKVDIIANTKENLKRAIQGSKYRF